MCERLKDLKKELQNINYYKAILVELNKECDKRCDYCKSEPSCKIICGRFTPEKKIGYVKNYEKRLKLELSEIKGEETKSDY